VSVLLAALILAAPHAPVAYVEPGHVRLAVSSWCWARRCGAPIAPSGPAAVAARGATVRVHFTFAPTAARVGVAGRQVAVARHGSDITWTAQRGGGMTINVTGAKGFVAYVGRLVVR
jgi:hypothetical protein